MRGKGIHIRAAGEKNHPQLFRRLPDEFFIRVTGAAAQLVVEMRDEDFPVILRSERIQRMQQHHRIHAAGNGDENFFAARKQLPFFDGNFHALEKFAHAEIVAFFAETGKRRLPCPCLGNHGAIISLVGIGGARIAEGNDGV